MSSWIVEPFKCNKFRLILGHSICRDTYLRLRLAMGCGHSIPLVHLEADRICVLLTHVYKLQLSALWHHQQIALRL